MDMVEQCRQAQWIWLEGAAEKNAYAGFVRTFDLDEAPDSARLGVFADTHYKLYVNGGFINAGPAPFRKPVIQVDEQTIADGKPGPKTQKLIELFRAYVESQ